MPAAVVRVTRSRDAACDVAVRFGVPLLDECLGVPGRAVPAEYGAVMGAAPMTRW